MFLRGHDLLRPEAFSRQSMCAIMEVSSTPYLLFFRHVIHKVLNADLQRHFHIIKLDRPVWNTSTISVLEEQGVSQQTYKVWAKVAINVINGN